MVEIAGVGHFDDIFACALVNNSRSKETVLVFISCDNLTIHGERQNVGALVVAIELLYIVGHGLHRAEIVEPDHIGTPLPALDVGEEGSIGSHVNDVGVALDACHVGGFVE